MTELTTKDALGELSKLDYFRQEYGRFRDAMCSTRYTPDQKEKMYGTLFMLYLNLDDVDAKKMETAIFALGDELQRRLFHERVFPRKNNTDD